ncbi:chaperonin 10-like protein [Fusarium redolens]|uniref:Chaperonin 10-like protein n=1 Tax=Fusarium redolens TaxID=48865 RepID=A0A9P9JL95_FUSRE|nr:chaperonin 10-like protein [Fusarium redolens]KAH7222543.1 chaperonin 10-like protein [Fusarium redolens]
MTAASITKALFIDSENNPKVIERQGLPTPSNGELLIKVLYSGVNPADIKHATFLGMNNTVMGHDFSGQVIETTKPNSLYKPGDIVAGYTPAGLHQSINYGAHQAYITCPEDMLFKVPDNLPLPDAASLTVVAMTAADALYNHFKFPLPMQEERSAYKTPFLLWGATGSVGYCALQFAIASGVSPIFVTANPAQFEHLRSLGVEHLFDYKDENVHESIAKTLRDFRFDKFLYAFDAAGAPNSGDQMLQAVSEDTMVVSTVIRESKRFAMPVAVSKVDFVIHPTEAPHPISIPARPADHDKAWKALNWAIENYGTRFRLPPVRVVEDTAEVALEEIKRFVKHGGGFSKISIKQPLA